MRVPWPDLYRWKREDRLSTVEMGGVDCVPMDQACAIVKMWRRSYSIGDARTKIGMSETSMRKWRKNGKLVSVESPFGYERFTRKSVDAFVAEREALRQKKFGSGGPRGMTIDDAAKYLGLQSWKVRDLVENATLRSFKDGDDILVYASSVEAHKKIRENGSLYLREQKKRGKKDRTFIPGKELAPVLLPPNDD